MLNNRFKRVAILLSLLCAGLPAAAEDAAVVTDVPIAPVYIVAPNAVQMGPSNILISIRNSNADATRKLQAGDRFVFTVDLGGATVDTIEPSVLLLWSEGLNAADFLVSRGEGQNQVILTYNGEPASLAPGETVNVKLGITATKVTSGKVLLQLPEGDHYAASASAPVPTLAVVDFPLVQISADALVGPQGPQGPEGPQGPQGPRGFTGAEGPFGKQGPQGNDGPAGPMGPQGVKGDTGAAGPVGAVGPKGETGAVGPVGPKGDTGATGATGPQGIAGPVGPAGPKGDTGAMGPAGLQGAQGPAGPSGPAGPKGDTGAMGPAGPQGAQGSAGPKGDTGAMGPAGPQGAQGPAGPQGEIGATGPQGPVGPKGDMGPQGPQGGKGDTGATGAQGPQGFMGPIGPQGPQGPQGIPGGVSGLEYISGTVTIPTGGGTRTRTAQALCSTAKKVIGGGGWVSSGDGSEVTLSKNGPSSGNGGWEVTGITSHNSSYSIDVVAICAAVN